MSNSVETIQTVEPGVLRFYSCGPTVYSYAHIGNFRTFLTADLIVRTAREFGWTTKYVSNITDVGHLTEDDVADGSGEDKMSLALQSKEGKSFANIWDLARFYADELLADWHNLNMIEPDVRPRATEHIAEQIRSIEQLIESGHAYETSSGVYFSINSFSEYGKLSGNTFADELEGATRELVVDTEKKDARDFALWKKDPKHLMQWHSPWGWGFPGWHMECSVMAVEYLGEEVDIHGGGEDLIFPHHECEIAQAESITGNTFAKYWVHTRFLQVEGEKMSKSKGNFFTVNELVSTPEEGGKGIDPLALRLSLISGHYRKPYNFTFDTLKANMRHIDRLRDAAQAAEEAPQGLSKIGDQLDILSERMLSAMLDDLNTPEAIAAVLEGSKLLLSSASGLSDTDRTSAKKFLQRVDSLLGILPSTSPATQESGADPFANKVEDLLQQRVEARKAKDYSRADEIRDELQQLGVEVMDSAEGVKWKRIVDLG